MKKISKDLSAKIRKRTRDGYGVIKEGAKKHPLPELLSNTVRRRKRLEREGKLTGPGATPPKSGVNRSGKTLKSLRTDISTGKVNLTLNDKGEKVSKELIRIDKGYTFMNVSKEELDDVVEKLENVLIDELNKKLR